MDNDHIVLDWRQENISSQMLARMQRILTDMDQEATYRIELGWSRRKHGTVLSVVDGIWMWNRTASACKCSKEIFLASMQLVVCSVTARYCTSLV